MSSTISDLKKYGREKTNKMKSLASGAPLSFAWLILSNVLLLLSYVSWVYSYFDPEKSATILDVDSQPHTVIVADVTDWDQAFRWFSVAMLGASILAFIVFVVYAYRTSKRSKSTKR